MLNNRSVKLLTIYIALHIPLCNIFIKKEKYQEFQYNRAVANLFHSIVFKLKEYNISIGAKYFSLQTIMFYICSHSSIQMETLIDNPSAKAIIIDLLV